MNNHLVKTTRRALCAAIACVVISSLAACGGSQQPAATQGSTPGQVGAQQTAGEQPDTPVQVERTAEEIEAERQAQLHARFQEAVTAYQAGREEDRDYARIERALRSVIELDAELPDVWFNLGQIFFEQGRNDEAVEAWNKAGEVDDRYARGMAAIAAMQLAEDQLDEARETLDACIERRSLEPGCNINLSLLDRLAAFEGRETIDPSGAQDAIDRLRFALAGDGRSAHAYAALARIYFDLGRLQLARLVVETAIQLDIHEAVLHNRLGLIALEEDDVISAYREFQRAVELDPRYRDARLNIGAMALSFRDYGAAADAFANVLEREPENLEARLSHGVALRGLERFEEAESQYLAVLEADPNNLGALINMGLLYQEFLQDYPKAVEWYERYLESGGEAQERAAEVTQRISVLRELIELLGPDA